MTLSPEQMNAAIEAAGKLQQRLVEAKTMMGLGMRQNADNYLERADTCFETLALSMGFTVADDKPVVSRSDMAEA